MDDNRMRLGALLESARTSGVDKDEIELASIMATAVLDCRDLLEEVRDLLRLSQRGGST